MKMTYLPEGNILTFEFDETADVAETIELEPRVFVDIDKTGRVIGFETWEAQSILERAKDGFDIPEKLKTKVSV